MTGAVALRMFNMADDPSDVIMTPAALAEDIVSWCKPVGRTLDPCRGDGAFWSLMPGAEWCEIRDGRDFFAFNNPVDWIVGNPPYSTFVEFLSHSFDIAANVVYLLPTNKVFQSWRVMDQIVAYGGIRAIRLYGGGQSVGMPFGFSVGAFHFERGWGGDTSISFCKALEREQKPRVEPDDTPTED